MAAVDLLAIGNWQRANAGQPKNKQTKPPSPLPRPGVPRREPVTLKQLLEQRRRLGR
jgi:hypothetical protein